MHRLYIVAVNVIIIQDPVVNNFKKNTTLLLDLLKEELVMEKLVNYLSLENKKSISIY